ncbi:Hypothetical protein, putative [Bodo saltans]|uniref:Membrane-associated protein n=1 Tax=Bodo saltans TaxID=75058 RepID=A0A0S4KNZ3_BODSA|nr:Hypothetical protein, putative [Bodo saltans]|eukprot:CUI14621.1 Hypothetical protein, putative [Bodo saltans]
MSALQFQFGVCLVIAIDLSIVLAVLASDGLPPSSSSSSSSSGTTTKQFKIKGYTTTYQYSQRTGGSTTSTPSWAVYDMQERSNRTRSSASNYDDNAIFDAIDVDGDVPFTAPFYQLDAASWYISSNGFLSPLRDAMCGYFCTGYSDAYSGSYQVSSSYNNGGGDWPAIQLYTCDLNPSSTSQSTGGVYKHILNKSYDGSMMRVALVEFVNIHLYSESIATVQNQNLTAQVEIWENGTIILRYASTYTIAVLASMSIPPGANLIWSFKQRTLSSLYSPNVMSARVPIAIRFDPVLDTCNQFDSCELCTGAVNSSRSSQIGCSWCGATRLCTNTSLITEYCSTSDTNECTLPEAPAAQLFYSVDQLVPSIDDDVWNDTYFGTNFAPPAPSLYSRGNWSLTSSVPITVAFRNWTGGQRFPIFYDPPVWNTSAGNRRLLDTMYITGQGAITFAAPSLLCSSQSLGYCQDGGYTYALVNVAAPNFISSSTSFDYGVLPERPIGAYMCGPAAASLNGNTTCPVAVYINVINLRKYWRNLPPSPQQWNFSILLDVQGRIAVHYHRRGNTGAVEPLVTYPKADFGLFRNGSTDGSSLDISWTTMTTGTTLVFTPQKSCDDCGIFFFFASLSLPWVQHQRRLLRVWRVKCATDRGWSGTNCTTWVDPCQALSLDGCPICTAYRNITCRYCSSLNVCVADPTQKGVGTSWNSTYSSCSPYLTYNQTSCTVIVQTSAPQGVLAVMRGRPHAKRCWHLLEQHVLFVFPVPYLQPNVVHSHCADQCSSRCACGGCGSDVIWGDRHHCLLQHDCHLHLPSTQAESPSLQSCHRRAKLSFCEARQGGGSDGETPDTRPLW